MYFLIVGVINMSRSGSNEELYMEFGREVSSDVVG